MVHLFFVHLMLEGLVCMYVLVCSKETEESVCDSVCSRVVSGSNG